MDLAEQNRITAEVNAMQANEQLLRFIHKNAAMGVGTIPQALSLPQSRAMRQALQDQLQEYRTITAKTQSYAKQRGGHLKGPGTAALAMSSAMLRAQAFWDPSTTKLAEMMIQGSTMGIIEETESLKKHPEADEPIQQIARDMIQFEQDSIERLKQYL